MFPRGGDLPFLFFHGLLHPFVCSGRGVNFVMLFLTVSRRSFFCLFPSSSPASAPRLFASFPKAVRTHLQEAARPVWPSPKRTFGFLYPKFPPLSPLVPVGA